MLVITIANQKGGVGKTTTTYNLGVCLARYHGKKTLMIDLDPQGNLTDHCNQNPDELMVTTYDLLKSNDPKPLHEVTLPLENNLYLVGSNISLSACEVSLVEQMARERTLELALEEGKDKYDFVLIDCPPSLGLLPINAFTAADYLLVPVQTEYFSLRGIELILQTLAKVKKKIRAKLEILGIVLTFYDKRKTLNKQILNMLTKNSPFGKIPIFKTVIRDNVALAEAPSHGQSIVDYKQGSPGAEDYMELATEFLKRIEEAEKNKHAKGKEA